MTYLPLDIECMDGPAVIVVECSVFPWKILALHSTMPLIPFPTLCFHHNAFIYAFVQFVKGDVLVMVVEFTTTCTISAYHH